MLPIIDEEVMENVLSEVMQDVHSWRKKMIHYIKEENPEVNTAIIQIAQGSDLDPKAVATGAYMTYLLLEKASEQDGGVVSFEE